jgi:ferrous iron transport protein A
MPRTLADLSLGEGGVLAALHVPPDDASRLMEHGFLPGARVRCVGRAPGGDPRVFRVDGADIALRNDTARRLTLARDEAP